MSTPSADVRLKVAANSAAAQFGMMSGQFKKMMGEMQRGTQRTGQEAKKANKSFGNWAGGIGKSVGGLMAMSTAMSGIYGVGQMITKQFEEQARFAKEARERQVPTQDLAKRFYFESIPSSVKDPEGFFKEVNQLVSESKVQDKANLWRLLKTTMSTMGNVEPMERVKFGLSIAEGRRDLMNMRGFQQLNTFAGVAGMAHLTFKDQGSTPDAQMGLMQKTITSSAVSDMTSFARNIAPVGNKLKILGANQVEGLGLAAALSTLFNDQTGQLVDTAANNIVAKLSMAEQRFGIDSTGKSLLERQAFVRSDDPKAKQLRKFILASFANDAEDLTDQDRAMMSQAELNKELAPKLGGRAKTLFGAMQFFQPQGTADGKGELNDLFKSAIKEIGGVYKKENVIDVEATYKNVAQQFRHQKDFVNQSNLFSAATDAMETKEAVEQMKQNRNEMYSELAYMDGDFNDLMIGAGRDPITRFFETTGTYWSDANEPRSVSLNRMRFRIEQQLRKIQQLQGDGFFNPETGEKYGWDVPQGAPRETYYPNPQYREIVTIFEEKLDSVVLQLEEIKKSNGRIDSKTGRPMKLDDSQTIPEKPKATEIGQ